MKAAGKLAAIALLLGLAAAPFTAGALAAPYESLDYVRAIRNMDFYGTRTDDAFAAELAIQYKSFALFRAAIRDDRDSANHFARKAVLAFHGERVRPEDIYSLGVPASALTDLAGAYDDLNKLLSTDLRAQYPQLVAEAQVKFDCWASGLAQGESGRQLGECRSRFMKARNLLYEKIDEESKCGSSCEVAVTLEPKASRVRRFDGRLLQIPRWPDSALVANNPPKPKLMEWKASDSLAISEAQKEIDALKAMLARIEAALAKNTAEQATKAQAEDILAQIAALDERVESLRDNGAGEILDQLDSIEERLAEIADCACAGDACTGCPVAEAVIVERVPEYKVVAKDDYIEEEIFARPSDLLPFEIFFDWNKDKVDYKFLPQLKDITDKALLSKESIVIRGHTDTSGTSAYNKDLSRRRALAVAKVLEGYGIEHAKIVIEALGETDLKVATPPGVKKPENRRAVIQ
jgi:outer membrane protein OmpA-like peptidoglycan-associated protein